MKLSFLFLIALLPCTITSAQTSPKPTKGPKPVLREPFTLKLAFDKEHYYEHDFEAIPYVNKGIVFLFKGEEFGILLSEQENDYPKVSYCKDLEQADVVFNFIQQFDEDLSSFTMLLTIESRLKKKLYMDGIVVVPKKESAFETNILPLEPGQTNYESWPHPIVQLAIQNLRFQEKKLDNVPSPISEDSIITLKDARIETLIQKHSETSRKELPDVIERFKSGLKYGDQLFITTRIKESSTEGFEQIFVRVDSINDDIISGKIASELSRIKTFKAGDTFSCRLDEVLDWTIQSLDGSEEGNYLGKFLGVVKDDMIPLVFEVEVATTGTVISAKFIQAINRHKQDVSFCVPEDAIQKAKEMIEKADYPESRKPEKNFIYMIYHFQDDMVDRPKPLEELRKKGTK